MFCKIYKDTGKLCISLSEISSNKYVYTNRFRQVLLAEIHEDHTSILKAVDHNYLPIIKFIYGN